MCPSSILSGASPPTSDLGTGKPTAVAACHLQYPAARLPTVGQQLSIAAPVKFGARPPLTYVGRAETLRNLIPSHLAPPARLPAAHSCVRPKIKRRKLIRQSAVAPCALSRSFPIGELRKEEYALNPFNSAPPRRPVSRGISDAPKRLRPLDKAPSPPAGFCENGNYH